MARFMALLRNTWWLWIAFLVSGASLSYFNPIFLFMLPLCLTVFVWFAYVRYDENGNFKGS